MPAWPVALKPWLGFSPRFWLVACGAAAVVVTCVAILMSLAGGSRAALFATALRAEQLDEVEQHLGEWSVPFTPLSDNVLVDGKRRGDLLLRLSLAGVPHAHIENSSEMLAKIGALTPQSIIDEQKRDGLAADLELALRGIDGVQDASIIVAPAKTAVYADEESHAATASVRLHLRVGAHLLANAIAGIRAFVAAGVPGLDGKHVTIVDDRGVALEDQAAGADAQELQASLQSALDAAFGAGISIVRVHIEYNRRAEQIKEVRRAPSAPIPISSARKQYARSEQSADSGTDVREDQLSVPAGSIARLSIAIAVDQHHEGELDQIRALAAASAGFDPRRGDEIDVQAVRFGANVPPRRTLWFGVFGAALSVAPTLIVCVAMLAGLRIGIKPTVALLKTILREAKVARTQRAAAGFPPTRVRGILRDEPPHTAAAIISALPAATAAAVLDMYPAEERAAIIRRMSRAQSPLVPDVETVIANA